MQDRTPDQNATARGRRIPVGERLVGTALSLPLILSRLLPYRWRVPFAGWCTAHILAPIAGYNRRVRDNLALVCPDMPKDEVARITRGATDNIGRSLVELFAPEFIDRMRGIPASGPGIEVLHAARAEGRPGIIISAHIANFNATRRAIVQQGIDIACFYRPMSNRRFNERYVRAMAAISQPIFEQSRAGLTQMVRHLRKGGVLAIMNDLNAHDGLPLDFMGQPALTSFSAAELALKYDAPLVPVWGRREMNGLDFSVTFEDAIPPTVPLTMTREYNRRLEAVVRRDMDQWFWIHRRWKDGSGPLADHRALQLDALERKLSAGNSARF